MLKEDMWGSPIIDRFEGDYAFLSNFYPAKTRVGDVVWPTAEHAYQSRKCANLADVHLFHGITAGQAKRLGKKVQLRKSWEFIKNNEMLLVVEAKFRYNLDLAKKLVDTGESLLIEGNTWGDKYWGMVDGVGHNWLGQILMYVRGEMKRYVAN